MNWVAPIKDDDTLKQYKEKLREIDDKYYIMFEIGVGTGMQLQEILRLRVGDVRGKKRIDTLIGTRGIKRSFIIPDQLMGVIDEFVQGRNDDEFLILGFPSRNVPLSREQAYRVLRAAGHAVGLSTIGAQTMRKTFAWHYYKRTGDIYYLQNLLNHSSPSITYRYIGEKPNVSLSFRKITANENERARISLCKDGTGKKRIDSIRETFDMIDSELNNPINTDAFYGKVDSLLDTVEEILEQFRAEMK